VTPERYADYLDRLTGWARSHPDVVGLVALGSTAGTTHQPDEWSDHDVWIVTHDGAAAVLRDDVRAWLPDAERIVMVLDETRHGRCALYDDGHLVELAVFDEGELDVARVNAHRVLHDEGGIADRLVAMRATTEREVAARPGSDHLVQEWAVQVVVALGRWARGERLSASSRVRGTALRLLLEVLAANVPPEQPADLDDLDPHRRFERAYPALGARLDAALAAPVPATVAEMLDIVETELSGRVPAVTPELLATVRRVLTRV
jgi:hypothetical protein